MKPPEGYLGAEARITGGPAPELVEAGYELEIADAPLLHRGLSLADLAHLVALVEAGSLGWAQAAPLVERLLALLDTDAEAFPYDATYGDAYNSRERELARLLGPGAGWLHLGRTRREAGRIAFRLALRGLLLDLHRDVAAFAATLAGRATEHASTVWADSTYLQPAQPSTFGHYLGGLAEQAVRHLARLEAAYRLADVCPAGTGGAGGTLVAFDSERVASLLGFTEAGRHTRDAMWSVDALLDAVAAAVQATLTVDQLAEDFEIFASPAFGYVELDASLCRASVLMPQKRNPYALAVLRGGAGTLHGRLAGLVTTARTPSARTDNWLYAYGEVSGALSLAGRLLRLGTAVVRGLRPRPEAMRAIAAENFVGAADLAESLSRDHHIDYRTTYRIVGRAIAAAIAGGATQLTADAVDDAAREVTGAPLGPDPAMVGRCADAAALVAGRTTPGGASPKRVQEHAADVLARLAPAEQWRRERQATNEQAVTDLRAIAGALVRDRPPDPGISGH
ncbi:lyase family protein [Amycolatopsis alkalitolerans]|uniref:argininosuccinate lyase n=1 Tax=Amycolatopsis alkalitolerans TaxID=2547244 RepID=A0A5C4M991_9PSEU|nr:lyase family protein [Amycolatopsis alkalitolerans]TNC28262.1 argininosuccinate lyase [Amycolatopsis alkalitolerans]